MDTYKIVRYFAYGHKRTIKTGCTLTEAQTHCTNPQSSSTTCTSTLGKWRTERRGPWFDGYVKE